MILCGSISEELLRDRLTRLMEGAGWNTWLTHDAAVLPAMLEAMTSRIDVLVSDDPAVLALPGHETATRILLAETATEQDGFFVVCTADDDEILLQSLRDCINASRVRARFHDSRSREPITRLPRHQELVARLIEHRGNPVALLVIQVDHAEHLYANLDPVSRTDLLDALASRLKLAVPAEGQIGFYDAGCFIVVLPGQSADGLMRVAEGIRTAARSPLIYRGGEIHLTVSIGCNHAEEYRQFDGLWQGAWQAVNRAAQEGGNRTLGGPREHISSRLPSALEREEFSLMLQGQWSSDELCGVEALLRWQGLDVGELAPSQFIPVAEQEGHITRIGDWVLEKASTTASTWLEHLINPLLLGVNVSTQQFADQAITRQIERLRRERWLDPAMLELELGLPAMLELVDDHRDQLYRLRDWGVRFAIDNLGTDLIDFDRLLRCPVDTLKIDLSLTAKVLTHPASRDLIREIIGIGERFQLRVVAVGVESPDQLAALNALGEIDMQGYLLAPPVPIEEFHQLLSEPSLSHERER
jgi:EAL domain-containing protein (putative c-di-GMP-specific phosphodiesterase class I)/GGDEF domain-containing protein